MKLNILCFDLIGSFIQNDIISTLTEEGHKVKNISYRPVDKYHDEKFEIYAKKLLSDNNFNLVFTANFHPELARICYEKNLPYISWVYDSPPNLPSIKYMDLPSNKIYFFNKDDTNKYKALGLDTVFHLPLAVNTNRLDTVIPYKNKYQVSFVGKMYEPILPTLKTAMNEFQKGFIDGIAKAQELLYGIDLVKLKITDQLVNSICSEYSSRGLTMQPTKSEISWALYEYISCLDRINLLKLLSNSFDTHLYSPTLSKEIRSNIPAVIVHPPVDYNSEMPRIFKSSLINLCPVIRANLSGIPLRVLDIAGCGGFILASYHQGIAEVFNNGEEILMYSSPEEARDLAEYYINHSYERETIARKGYEKVKKDFSYKDRIRYLLKDFI